MVMDKLIKTLENIQTLLKKKSMSFKAGQNLSSPTKPTTPSVKAPEAPKPEAVKAVSSKKDATKVAEQIQQPDIKKQVMKEAVKISKQGQWSIKKTDEEPQMASPENPKEGRTRDKKTKKDNSELLYPGIEHSTISKAEDGPHYHIYQDGQKLTDKPMHHNDVVRQYGSVQRVEAAGYRLKPATPSNKIEKQEDDLDAKIKSKMKAEMDKRNFTETDATRHKIDVDRGDKQAAIPKSKKLLN
jgi:hypothetical protein